MATERPEKKKETTVDCDTTVLSEVAQAETADAACSWPWVCSDVALSLSCFMDAVYMGMGKGRCQDTRKGSTGGRKNLL